MKLTYQRDDTIIEVTIKTGDVDPEEKRSILLNAFRLLEDKVFNHMGLETPFERTVREFKERQ